MWHSIQVCYLERDKNQQVLGSYHNFHLTHQILVRPMELQRRHIRVLQEENFRLRRDEISEIHQDKGQPARQSQN
jgi:hypothetical protein